MILWLLLARCLTYPICQEAHWPVSHEWLPSTYTTWKTLVEERLQGSNTEVLYVVSDRAKALIQLAEQGLECLSMPDFFHVAREIVQSYSLAIGQRWRHAQQELTKAKEALVRRQGLHHTGASNPRGPSAG